MLGNLNPPSDFVFNSPRLKLDYWYDEYMSDYTIVVVKMNALSFYYFTEWSKHD